MTGWVCASKRGVAAAATATATALAVSLFGGSAIAGPTTASRSWTPPISGGTFQQATTCHDVTRDVYVIGAVFRFPDLYFGGTYDVLYQLRVQGSSVAGGYGELLGATALTSSRRIDNVDCTSDDGSNVFLAYDRMGQDAAWFRLNGSEVHGPYTVERFGLCGPSSHRPRLAFATGATRRLMVAYEGYTFGTGEHESCEACVHQIDPDTGAGLPSTASAIWNDNMTHSDYDVEWNGARFVFALPYQVDAGDGYGHLSTYVYDLNGVTTGEHHIQSFYATPTPGYPDRTRIVHSRSSRNTYNRLFIQTNLGSYWLYPGGSLVPTPQSNALGTGFAVCEYWGADNGVAATFSPTTTYRWVPGFPFGSFVIEHKTRRAHYGQSPGAAYESTTLNAGYYPAACDGANTYADPEVFLVSKPSAGPDAKVYWNIVSND